jgi:uncharacterized hydrophobic protein (TIGR00271 family)
MKKKIIEQSKPVLALREHDFTITVNRQEVLSSLKHEARFNIRYIFMTIISVSIATMGIIQNDIVVVVGAMLIAPMMNPIVLLGFSICRFNKLEFIHSIRSILIGILVCIGCSFLIVKISPMQEITDQILSRTQPNIYNLLVALFSGAGGTYTKIKRKGGEIIGVAIASSLIPPLSVVGFSLAIGHYYMAREALFLFLTNLVAIALSGTILARWYGFGFSVSKNKFLLQVTSYCIALVIFSVPLILALKEIVFEVQAKHIISNQINNYLDKDEQIEDYLNSIKVTFYNKKKASIDIRAAILTKSFDKHAERKIKESLEKSLGKPVHLVLEQIIYQE